jgi:phosphatidate cytidylyltransferase
MLKKRVITALWGIPLIIIATWLGDPWFAGLVAIWGGIAVLEFYGLLTAAGQSPLTYFGVIWAILFILSHRFSDTIPLSLLLTSAVMLPLIWLLFRRQKEGAFAGWAWTIAGILYLGWLLSHLVALRGMDAGRNWVFFTIFVIFATDTAAYFIGRAWGRHRLAPHISPNKTWEGALGGVLGAIIVSLLFVLPHPLRVPLGYGQAILLGLVVSVFGQLGDLVKSLFKRNTGAKDSGKVLAGHGGALDRIDSIVFAGVVVYYYVISLSAGPF